MSFGRGYDPAICDRRDVRPEGGFMEELYGCAKDWRESIAGRDWTSNYEAPLPKNKKGMIARKGSLFTVQNAAGDAIEHLSEAQVDAVHALFVEYTHALDRALFILERQRDKELLRKAS